MGCHGLYWCDLCGDPTSDESSSYIRYIKRKKERDCSCCDRCVDDDQCVENESDGERIYLSASDNVEICEVTRKCETLNIATQLPLKK